MFSSRVGFFNQAAGGITVTGGTLTIDGDFAVRTFSTSDNLVITGGDLTNVQYLIIAGGGAGSNAGGGAGGIAFGTFATLTAGTYAATIGQGGTSAGVNGGNTVFNSITVTGGGAGATAAPSVAGNNGGSGGGGSGCFTSGCTGGLGGTGISGPPRQGRNGSAGTFENWGGAGGGYSSNASGQNGGNGYTSTITGVSTVYAGGGRGYRHSPGFGTAGPGNNGTGQNNAGGGGEANQFNSVGVGRNGVVIIRYLKAGTK